MGKRGQNEGSIFKLPGGGWRGQVTIPASGGKRRSVRGATRREVAEKITALRAAIDRGESVDEGRQTVGAYLDRWLAEVIAPRRTPSTHRNYEALLRLHIKPEIGDVPLAKLTPQRVQQLLNDKARGDLLDRPCTVQRMRECLRSALNTALRWGLVTRNAAALVEPPRYDRPEASPLSQEEARTFLAAIRGDRQEALYTVAIALGLREGEALGLAWGDVDWEAGTIVVRRQVQRVKGEGLVLRELKTRKSRRTLPLPASLVPKLRHHRAIQQAERLAAGRRWKGNPDDLIFASTIGTMTDPTNVWMRFQWMLGRAGLDRQRFHDLRHTCATLLLVQGVDARLVMEVLGHSDIRITQNTYQHVVPKTARVAADSMDAFLVGEAG